MYALKWCLEKVFKKISKRKKSKDAVNSDQLSKDWLSLPLPFTDPNPGMYDVQHRSRSCSPGFYSQIKKTNIERKKITFILKDLGFVVPENCQRNDGPALKTAVWS